jgi:hypothetical protein
MRAPTTQAARIVAGPMSWAMKPALTKTPAPIILPTTSPIPERTPSSLGLGSIRLRMVLAASFPVMP